MKKLYGPAILGVLALSFILGSLFKPFGLGGGNESGTATDEAPGLDHSDQIGVIKTTTTEATSDTMFTNENIVANVDPIPLSQYPMPLQFSVSEYQYNVMTSQDTTKIVTLDEAVALIESVKPDRSGVRARISRYVDAQDKAEEDLKKALKAKGIDDTEVIWENQLIPPTVQ